MNIVGIHGLGEKKETLAGPLAGVLGVTNYEATARLRSPGAGPLTVAVFAERERAVQLAERLQSAGFNAAVLSAEEIEAETGAWIVRRFGLGDQDLLVEKGKDARLSIPYSEIDLILRGTGIASSSSSETTMNRSFNLGLAVATGGMMMSKTTKTVREVTSEEREGFIKLYAGERQTLVFHENGVVCDSLGPHLKPSRTANFAYLTAELRRRCQGASYDERLLSRAGQAALLGPALNPEKHLAVATALLSKVLRGRA